MSQFKHIILIIFVSIIGTNMIGQTIFSNNGKYGIIDNESKEVVIFAEYDMITAGSINESYGTTKSAHSFILKKDNKYYFLLKKYWKTSTTKQNADSG